MSDLTTNKDLINPDDPTAKRGIKFSKLYDPTNSFLFNNAPCEDVWQGDDNTFIVLGRDRPGGWESGYGSEGHLKAGAIDIVTGRLSGMDARVMNSGPVNPNFGADAARIYLSQKTDVDRNFSLSRGMLEPTLAQSAVAIKADAVRIIARETLKLITNTDALLSNGDNVYSGVGVQLIAQGKDKEVLRKDMHPIPLGKNLVEALALLADKIIQLNGIVGNFYVFQKAFNEKIAQHTHYTGFYDTKSAFDPESVIKQKQVAIQKYLHVEQALNSNTWNLKNVWKPTYLVSGPKYINSTFHYLN